jgi:hypothetical protein
MKKSPQPGADRAAATGPRSAEGKARSSMNALKSGIYSKSLTIPGEDPAHLTTLTEEYFQRYLPAFPEQRDLVDILVRSTWTLRRLATAEAQVWTYQMDARCALNAEAPMGHAFNFGDRSLSRLQRMVNSTQRNFRDALRELQRLQAPEPAPQPTETKPVNSSKEFVSSTSVPPPPEAPREALPFHLPGRHCNVSPIYNDLFKRCPSCFPEDGHPDAQD